MKKELDEDIFEAMKQMADDIHFVSRNYNDELIGIDYYKNLHTLSQQKLQQLDTLWALKCRNCLKEKLASQWFVIQLLILVAVAIYIATISTHVIVGTLAGCLAVGPLVVVLDTKRVRIAKRNLADARKVHEHLQHYIDN